MQKYSYQELRNKYCNFLLESQSNYTCSYMSAHTDLSHDKITRFLNTGFMEERHFYEYVHLNSNLGSGGYLIFDDTVLDKSHCEKIEMVRRQYSGNVGGVILGIGVVVMGYYQAHEDKFDILGYRIFDPDFDGKTKIDHVIDLLKEAEENCVGYVGVLMDKWYAVSRLFQLINSYGKFFYCPIKTNRLVKTDEKSTYLPVGDLSWNENEGQMGKSVKVKDLGLSVFLHKITISTNGNTYTNYILTNDIKKNITTQTIKAIYKMRWHIEDFNREVKQLTGIEKCQCRNANAQKTHIYCAILVWNKLKNLAYNTFQSLYKVKLSSFKEFLTQQLKMNTPNFTF